MHEKEKRKTNYLNNYHIFIKNSGYKHSFLNDSVTKTYRFIKTPAGYKNTINNLLSNKGLFGKNKPALDKSATEKPVFHIFNQETKTITVPTEDQPSLLHKTGKLLVTFSKDVIFGTSLLVVGTLGLVVVAIAPRALFDNAHHNNGIYAQQSSPSMQVSPFYQSFLNKMYLHEDATKEILALKEQGLINEVNPANGFTPLVHAIHLKNKHAIETLVTHGASINLATKDNKNTLISQLVYYNPEIHVTFETYTEITEYLLSKGLDWKQNDYQLLKATSQDQEWRDFWINYFAKNSPNSLNIYKDILQNSISDKDILLHNTLKQMK